MGVREKQLQLVATVRTLNSKCSQRASSLTGEGEVGCVCVCVRVCVCIICVEIPVPL